MTLKKYCLHIFCLLFFINTWQVSAQTDRLAHLKQELDSLKTTVKSLDSKTDFNVNNVSMAEFLRAMANATKLNLNIDPSLNNITVKNNFTNTSVADILFFVCKTYDLTIDFTGSILSIHKYKKPYVALKARNIPIVYDKATQKLSADFNKDTLYVAFKQLMAKTGKNLVFKPGMSNLLLTAYIQNMTVDAAFKSLAVSNNLNVHKTKDGFYLFETNTPWLTNSNKNTNTPRGSNFFYEIINPKTKLLNVAFVKAPIASIVNNIGYRLKQNMFTSAPLTEAGEATVKADSISFDLLLTKILENTDFSYKKQDSIYYFGKKKQMSLRDAVLIPLMHRSIAMMKTSGTTQRRAGRINSNVSPNYGSSNYNGSNNFNRNRQNINTQNTGAFSARDDKLESLISILPDDVVKDLKIGVDVELNSFIVSGPSQSIERFKEFVSYIDKPVPVILIEVMLIEVNKSATVETGISWGIGTEPTTTQGTSFPDTDITLGAKTVNRIIGGFNSFGSWNLGQVVPNFYAKIKALETNGDINIRSTPKLSALNGHRASLSIGETTYYAVTQRDIIGSQNPQTSTIVNYQPIDAEFAINIKPMVSGDGQITLDINVIQSSFNGKKIADDAPPGVNSREFNSIIRVKDKDMVILGGLEETVKNDTGTGVPFLARIPIIKWFFSKRKREASKKKLTILIKPTIIR